MEINDKIISIDNLFLLVQTYIDKFKEENEQIINDPQYPKAARILAKTFSLIAARAQLYLNKKIGAYHKFITEISDRRSKNFSNNKFISFYKSELKKTRITVEGVFSYFKKISSLIRYIKSSTIENTPQGIIYPFQKIINFLFPKSYIFLRRQWKHNYKYGDFIKQILESDSRPYFFDYLIDELNFNLCMVSYPILCEDNYLYNCNIAHEIGHYISDIEPFFTSFEDFETKIGIDPALDIDQSKKGDIVWVGYFWYLEFIADIFASLMLGPAYLFSFIEFNETNPDRDIDYSIIEEESFYPSTRMRLYCIIKTITDKRINFEETLKTRKEEHPWLKLLSERIERVKTIVQPANFRFNEEEVIESEAWKLNKKYFHKYLEYALQSLEKATNNQNLKGETIFNLELLDKNLIKKVYLKINKDIPINELIKVADENEDKKIDNYPLNIYLILNFGWLRFFEMISEYEECTDEEKEFYKSKINNLNLIIKRSVEASYLHAQYLENRKHLEL